MNIDERLSTEFRLIRRYREMLYSLNDYELEVLERTGVYSLEELEEEK